MCYHDLQKGGGIPVNVLISTPWLQSVQTTNVAPLSRMCIWYNYYYYCYYLRNILERVIVKGREGLKSAIATRYFDLFCWSHTLGFSIGSCFPFCGSMWDSICDVFICSFLFLYYVFCKYTEKNFMGFEYTSIKLLFPYLQCELLVCVCVCDDVFFPVKNKDWLHWIPVSQYPHGYQSLCFPETGLVTRGLPG